MAQTEPKLVDGYPSLAHAMGLMPEFGILRRFATLNTQDLLYRQAEIVYLEHELRECELRSNAAPSTGGQDDHSEHAPQYATDWSHLGHSDVDGDQWRLFLTLREKLDGYSELPQIAARIILLGC